MTTAQEIYKKALALYDEISKTGTIDPTKTKDYEVRTPDMIDMFQKELATSSGYTRIYEYNYIAGDPETWVKEKLPDYAKSVKGVVIENNNNSYLENVQYKTELDGTTLYLYLKYREDCTVRVQCNAISPTITSLNDELVISENAIQGIAYKLTKWFAISEHNADVAKWCDNEFSLLKIQDKKPPSKVEPIVDVYGG